MSNDNSVDGHPRVPYGAVDDDLPEDINARPEDLDDSELLEDPDKLESYLSEETIGSVTIEGPVSAETISDITPKSITLKATVVATADEEITQNVCALANSRSCVRTTGSAKIDGKYVPEELIFKKTFQFDESVDDVEGLQTELRSVFGSDISIDFDE